jgi:hypothetical protein
MSYEPFLANQRVEPRRVGVAGTAEDAASALVFLIRNVFMTCTVLDIEGANDGRCIDGGAGTSARVDVDFDILVDRIVLLDDEPG